MSEEKTIDKLAASYGIESEFTDNRGRIHTTPIETKKKILNAMGIRVDSAALAKEAWRSRLQQKRLPLAEPTIICSVSDLPEDLVFQVPAPAQQAVGVTLAVTDEQGVTDNLSYTQKDLSCSEDLSLAGTSCRRWHIPFPRLDSPGYYWFHLSVVFSDLQESQAIFVAVCPDKAFIPPALQGNKRAAGISLSLYGVRSERNWGVGDLGDLRDLVDWVAEDLCGGIIGINPLHATFNRAPFNISPYLPMSRFYRNFIYLDIAAIDDYADSSEARARMKMPETQQLLSELRASEKVQYERVAELKEAVLRQLFQTFLDNHWNRQGKKTDRRRQLEDYIRKEGRMLANFATFCALSASMHSKDPQIWTWFQWPSEYQRPDSKAVRKFRQTQWQEILFHKYVQWQLEKQLAQVQHYAETRGMCIGLYHDLALAIDRFGADFWAYQDSFIPELRLGAPPDAFSHEGQDWGCLPPDMERFRQNGYELFIREIQKNCSFAGALRIDHVMRLFRLYCIPADEPPKQGAYVSQPFEDLLGIVVLESVRNQVVIIGEDLGTVPPHVRKILNDRNIFSYRLLYFERDDQDNFIRPQDYPELALATVATHDLPTFAGFWSDTDIKIRKEAGIFQSQEAEADAIVERDKDKKKLLAVLDDLGLLCQSAKRDEKAYPEVTDELRSAVMGFVAMTSAKLFVLTQEDLLGAVDQQNLPGTTNEYPNWSLKMKYSVEELRKDAQARAFCRVFRAWVKKTGRKCVAG